MPKNILIIGANFKNKGAEAMALTAAVQFGRMYPGRRITVCSYAKKESLPYGDHEAQSSGGRRFGFELVKTPWNLLRPARVLLCGLTRSDALRKMIVAGDSHLERFEQADLVVDLSGFAMSDQRSLLRRLVYCFEIFTSRRLRKPFVIMTQALGPFDSAFSRFLARRFLPLADLLIARGADTLAHLEKLGLHRRMEIPVCADAAYLFPAAAPEAGERILAEAGAPEGLRLGIVVNINIFHAARPRDENNPYIDFLARVCNHAESIWRVSVVFVCHESYENRLDDPWLARQARSRANRPDRIHIVDARHSAAEMKAVVGRLDFLVGSRFHSIVAAISMATPAMALGWAHKYRELMSEAGLPGAIFEHRPLDPERFCRALDDAWRRRDETRRHLEKRRGALVRSARKAYDLIAQKWPGEGADEGG